MAKPILYTIDCPACKILEKKLNNQGIDYDTVDARENNPKNIVNFPMLEVEGELKSYSDAVKWVNAQQTNS